MATVDVVSFSLVDQGGDVKAMPFHIPTGMTVPNIQAGVNAFAPVLDAVVDGLIQGVQVTLQLALPGGLKTTKGNNMVHEGALLTFDAANTNYNHSIFVPSWSDAGFNGKAVVGTGAYATFLNDVLSGLGTGGSELKPCDRYGNDLTSMVNGARKFRK